MSAIQTTDFDLRVKLRRAEEQVVRLARLLAVIVAQADGRIDVPYRWFDELPGDVKLIEHYDSVNDVIVLRTGKPNPMQDPGANGPAPTPAPSTDPTQVVQE